MSWDLRLGDCIEVMTTLPEASVDAVVTDPPYGLEFMGKTWDRLGDIGGRLSARGLPRREGDEFAGRMAAAPAYNDRPNVRCRNCGHWRYSGTPCRCGEPDLPNVRAEQAKAMQEWHTGWAREALRVLKPGGHLVAFGGTRTYHRLACGIEDAGFELRPTLMWLFGSGFPKSLNLDGDWQGWGTALKPAYEPIVMARKPLARTVAATVQRYGTGALNIDGTRIGSARRFNPGQSTRPHIALGEGWRDDYEGSEVDGRWPADVVLSCFCEVEHEPDCPVRLIDEASGESVDGVAVRLNGVSGGQFGWGEKPAGTPNLGYGGSGGASRFFYSAKASRSEREAGLEEFEPIRRTDGRETEIENPRLRTNPRRNDHPTVKPVALMRWLCRLVTPPGGVILDPFLGSGTTALAALDEGFRVIGIEREPGYLAKAEARVQYRHDHRDEPLEPSETIPQGRLF